MNITLCVLFLFLTGLIIKPFPAAAGGFCDNLRQVAAALPKNTSSSPEHFATAAVGQAPDTVYALAFCRGDIANDTACGDYYGDCHVFYSGDDIAVPSNATEQNEETPFVRWNVKNVTGSAADVRLIVGLIHELLVDTVEAAAAGSAAASRRRFATGAMDSGTTFPTVYSMAQCAPDLSSGGCLACLRRLVGMVNSTMALRMGAQIHVMRCFFRAYEQALGNSIIAVPLAAAAFLCFIFYPPWSRRNRKGSQDMQGEELVWDGKNTEFSVFDFEQVLEATDHFSEENKLGQGGFGAVFKGQFAEGIEIAVKRLASHSGQDENRRALLDWSKLLVIIEGIAHGLLYLHKHSRLRVIHRDLKSSNILLDNEMNPKISDFGLAKIFSSNNTQANTTRRVVGTYGYMAPEYASEGIFSIKSDVFSFGVLVLEILSGKRNSGSYQCGDFINLIGYAWQLWKEDRWIDLIDASLTPTSHSAEMMRCIKIALLCVQENAADRPTMADVVAMLSSETTIMAEPKQPAYFNVRVGNEEASITTESCSINDVTISVTTPR
ncbi:unnamed protein product [Urochloa decumbens]|uniref:Uncharacterized protein n=1 Tax=Urochloa decumbens TaxID=240449 RepID=A0ABC8XXN2_9POAL